MDPTSKSEFDETDSPRFSTAGGQSLQRPTVLVLLLVESGGKSYSIFPQGELTEGYLRTILEAGVRRMTGYLKTIGLVTKQEQTISHSGCPVKATLN